MPFWYSLATALVGILSKIIRLRSGKGRQWQAGQQQAWGALVAFKQKNSAPPYWFHCASLGEFEQAKPILLALRAKNGAVPVVVTFFSPSGYEARKNYAQADLVCYLPLDAPGVAQKWVNLLQPKAVFWVKYEFWLGYLAAVSALQIPLHLLAARPKPSYFTGIKRQYYTQAYTYFNEIFLQYPEHIALLPQQLKGRARAVGDPRFDNVLAGAANASPIPILEAYRAASTKPILLVGSAWQQDIDMLLPAWAQVGLAYRLVVFPHEMHPEFLQYLAAKAPSRASFWSKGADPTADVLVVDQVGFLFGAYQYADVAWVGGGFGKGLHNILEAAVWGKPVLHGPRMAYFPEATRLGEAGGGFAVSDAAQAVQILTNLLELATRLAAGQAARQFVESQAGATTRIMQQIKA